MYNSEDISIGDTRDVDFIFFVMLLKFAFLYF